MAVAVDLTLSPSLDEVRELARDHTLVPLRHTFIADCETPVSAYLKLRGDGPSFLLESAEQGQQVGRWSFLGFRPRAVLRLAHGEHPDPYALVAEDFEIAGASPETLVTVSGRVVRQRPIAGTRPRADSVERDLEQARELLADPKERAEHVMLVDLGRNDLGRVCEYGTVKVSDFFTIEKYSHVMHIVSHVSGRLRPGVGAFDALRSVLPAGTLSGAPKVRAMQIIDELEPVKRGG